MLLLPTLLFLISRCFIVVSSGCYSDRNKDHRPRVSCTAQSLSAVPDGIDLTTQVLVFTQNQFTSLSWAAYYTFTHLHELDLSQNHISVIDSAGAVLGSLSVLRLSSNRLMGLGSRVFSSTPRLMEIYLDGNSLGSLHEATFSDLPHLEVINLSRNQLTALPPRLLECVSSPNLKTFDLEENSVQIMPDGFFSSKPDLPYVFLSQNVWRCSCEVSYLQLYLEDQAHNVYQHTGPTSIENSPESVVCAGPAHLRGQPIVDLKKDDYCSSATPPDTPTNTLMTTPMTTDTTTDAPTNTLMTALMAAPTDPTSYTPWPLKSFPGGDMDVWYVQSTTRTSTHITSEATTSKMTVKPATITTTEPSTFTPSATPSAAGPDSTLSYTVTYIWTRIESWTVKHNWLEDWTLKWNGPAASTDRHEPSSSPSSTPSTHTDGSSILPTPSTRAGHASVGPPRGRFGARWGGGRGLWCWWLSAGLLPLCLLSGICCCMLFLWLLRTYDALYRPLQEQALKAAQGGAVTLQAYRAMDREEVVRGPGADGQPESVVFLPPERIRETQAVFRSVLFISKGEEEDGNGTEEGVAARGSYVTGRAVEEEDRVGVSERGERGGQIQREGDRDRGSDTVDAQEVFRKTLYRVISREEERGGWREVMEGEQGGRREADVSRGNTRYSLILREERGSLVEHSQAGTEWVVGEWQTGGGGGGVEVVEGWRDGHGGGLNQCDWGPVITSMENRTSANPRSAAASPPDGVSVGV